LGGQQASIDLSTGAPVARPDVSVPRTAPGVNPTQSLRARLAGHDTLVMGILNVTPDSFSDGGAFVQRDRALDHALRMVDEGADIIDIGGESTRPGAVAISAEEELDRVIPVIKALRGTSAVPVSIDTSKPQVMRGAVQAGANLINDVAALQADGAVSTAVELGVPVCLMHMQGTPRTMQSAPRYADVVAEVAEFLAERARDCLAAGMRQADILLDPGFGFGKTPAHNWRLLRELRALVDLGYPVLVGVSRKSTVAAALGTRTEDRLIGSVTAAALAAHEGARLLRVHDVAQTKQALVIVEAFNGRQPRV